MKFSKRTAFFLGSMIIISFLFSNIFSTSNLDPKLIFIEKYFDIGDKINNLIWFVQITDIHISIFRDPSRITQFKDFCLHTIDAIKPITVLASGDLTDAKTKDQVGSTQIEKEWQYYRDILRETQIENKTLWLDIRGNHDSFNVVGHLSKNNFFTNYSIQGKLFPRSYMYQIKKDNATYTFVAIDACLDPGPKRPFNFVGILDKQEIDHIDEMLKALKSSSNYTIWFGHFPTSCILTYGEESVRDIIGKDRNGLVYLCGHLHKMGGLVPSMYTLQNAGFLELELGDWKDNRMYRILAIDHGIFSFIDVEMDEWPVVLITNPKNALFINPQRENLDSIRTSRFIRILAFSLSDITSVKVKVNKENWLHCRHVSGPLYVVPWNPQLYFEGLHDIQVFVKDKEGRTRIINQQFSLDGTQLTFNMMPKILLSSNANVMFRMMFTIMVIISIGPLLFVRYLNDLIKVGRVSKLKHNQSIWKLWIRKLCLLSTIDRIFWPLVLYPIYLCFGPWSIGYIIEEHIGVIFAWGIYIRGSFLPGSFTYVYGFIQLLTFQVPLILILAHGVDQRFQYNILKPGRKRSMLNMVCAQLPFLILIFVQLEMAYFFWLAYGTLAFLLGPLRTWSVFVALALWHQTLTFPISYVGRATAIWCPKPAEDDPQTPKI